MFSSISGWVSFHSMQADWQALQPMHFETSMSLATLVSSRSGGRLVAASPTGASTSVGSRFDVERLDRRVRDGGRRLRCHSRFGVMPPVLPVAVDFSMLTRNALNSGVSTLASPTKGVSEFGPQPLRAEPVKPQCSGMPTTWTVLPSQVIGFSRLVTTALAHTSPRFDQTRTQSPPAIPLSPASSDRDLHEELRLEHRVHPVVLGPVVEVLGQPVGGRRRRGTPRARRARRRSPRRSRRPAPPGCPASSGSARWRSAPRRAPCASGTARRASSPG